MRVDVGLQLLRLDLSSTHVRRGSQPAAGLPAHLILATKINTFPSFAKTSASTAFEPLAFLLLSRSAPISIEKLGGDEHGTRNHGVKIQSILRLSRKTLESL